MREQALIAAFLLIPAAAHAAGDAKTHRSDHVVVSYSGIGEDYAKAIATTVEAARAVAADRFGSDMPNEITVTVRSDPRGRVRLFNDGQDRFELTVRGEKDLRRPAWQKRQVPACRQETSATSAVPLCRRKAGAAPAAAASGCGRPALSLSSCHR